MSKCPIRPLANRVVVSRTTGVRVTKGGILIPDHAKTRERKKVHEGTVEAVGPGARLADGSFGGPPAMADGRVLAVGDKVVFTTLGGEREELRNGQVWVLLNEHDVLCVVE